MGAIDKHLAERGLVRVGAAAAKLNVRHERLTDLGEAGQIQIERYAKWNRTYLVISEAELRRLSSLLSGARS